MYIYIYALTSREPFHPPKKIQGSLWDFSSLLLAIQAGIVAGGTGFLVGLPVEIIRNENFLISIGGTAFTCALLGLVYRYAVRVDDSFDLKGGAAGSMAIIRGKNLSPSYFRFKNTLMETFA